MRKFLLYAMKWQLGTIITVPLLYLFIDILHLSYLWSTICFNLVGAAIFFPIDLWIFRKKDKNTDNY